MQAMHYKRRATKSKGFTIIELLITIAIIGTLSAIGLTLLPRQNMAVTQAQRIMGSGVRYARFEAIKRNQPVTIELVAGASELTARLTNDGTLIRSFELNPQEAAVVIKLVDPNGIVTFNARGVATAPVARNVTIGITGRADYDRSFTISGQGTILEAP